MSDSNIEWQRNKAESVIRHQVELVGKSQCPNGDFASGFIEAYYAVELIDDERLGYWNRRLELTVQHRRLELREKKHGAPFNGPELVNGNLIAGGLHGNG